MLMKHYFKTVFGRHTAKVLAAIAAFSISATTVFSFAACQKQPVSTNETPAPQSPAAEATTVPATPPATEEASLAPVPTAPPATEVPVFGEYTNPCQSVKVSFPAIGNASAFSVNFDLPEGWTVKPEVEADGSVALSDFCTGMDVRKLILDADGNCVGAICSAEYDKQAYSTNGIAGVYAAATLMNHVRLFTASNYHAVIDDSADFESGFTSAYHECTPNDWTVGNGFHAFENPAAAAFAKSNPVFVIVELSNSIDNAAGLAAHIAGSISFD